MVFVKVRETYDLHTVKNKMTVIGIHTPKPDIIKKNYPGLLMQCKAYRPVSCDVRIACASMLPLDPKGVGLTENDVAPEDVFNPILYKAMSNLGMSQLEARINAFHTGAFQDVAGNSADVDVDSITSIVDEFPLYYGLLSDTNNWKHAMPQAGLSMKGLKPLVWEVVYNIGDNINESNGGVSYYAAPGADGIASKDLTPRCIRGHAKKMPFINCTSYSNGSGTGNAAPGFPDTPPINAEIDVPYLNVYVGAIVVAPSRLHELFYRMVVEWTIEFSGIRSLTEITSWNGLAAIGAVTHYQNYSYEATKEAVMGSDSPELMDNDSCMVSSNVDVEKVM